MDSCFGGFAYGAAAGIDLTAGATCLAIASQRRPRDDRLLCFAALALLATGAMGLLYSLEAGSEGSSAGDLDRAFAVSTLCAFVPLAWYLGVSWSHQKDDEHLSIAGFHLLVAALFALNRFDALVASGTIDMVFLQPFAFPLAVTGGGVTRGARKLASARCDTTRRRAAATARSAQRGLQIMRERAAGIGVDLRIRSRPGGGTQLRLTWPAPGLPQARTVER